VTNYKQIAGEKAAEFCRDGMVLGLGSGSTAAYAVIRIGQLLREGKLKDIVGIPTSSQTAKLAREWNIPLTNLQDRPCIDLTIDGADEVDPQRNLIKGGGGCLLREKIVARASRREIIVVDPAKLVGYLGHHFLLPVEVIPFGWNLCQSDLIALGLEPQLRLAAGQPYVTDEGNYILDCRMPPADDLAGLEKAINNIPGVVENGLFLGYADLVIVSGPEGIKSIGSLAGPGRCASPARGVS